MEGWPRSSRPGVTIEQEDNRLRKNHFRLIIRSTFAIAPPGLKTWATPPVPNKFYGLIHRYNIDPGRKVRDMWTVLDKTIDVDIKNFDEFVPDAMAYFSDTGQAPPGVTWGNVTKLCQQIRKSLKKEAPTSRGE